MNATTTVIISAMAISQFVFLAAHFATHYRNPTGKLVAGFCLCAIAYLVDESMSVAESSLIDFGLGQLATLAPFLLWLIASNLFVDESKKHTLAWLALALCYALDIYGAVVYSGHEGPGSNVILDFSFNLLPQLILLSFPLHAIYLAMRGYGVDLLEERRKFRIAFIAGLGVVVVFIVASNILQDMLQDGLAGESEPYTMLASFCLFVVTLTFNLGSIQSSSSTLKIVSDKVPAQSTAEPAGTSTETLDRSLVQAIERAMDEVQLYKEPGLTISGLAEHVGVLEYKARNVINKSMRYKNFNQFLNHYRIKEACRLIQSTKLPVSRIAMDVGYSSLSAFNRAFRERMDTTPSDYRKHQGSIIPD